MSPSRSKTISRPSGATSSASQVPSESSSATLLEGPGGALTSHLGSSAAKALESEARKIAEQCGRCMGRTRYHSAARGSGVRRGRALRAQFVGARAAHALERARRDARDEGAALAQRALAAQAAPEQL